MCGIAGQISFEGESGGVKLDLMAHRGPDASGQWNSPDGSVWLGHRRLSILDLSAAGNQPMIDEVTGNVIVFNGEIYNHLELREQLPKEIEWKSSSDTETLLVAFRVWGVEAFLYLRGMFAFGLWDVGGNCLWLVRDPLGIKPLYVKREEQSLCFASEVRPLVVETEALVINHQALSHFIAFGAFDEKVILNDAIHMVPPSSWVCYDRSGNERAGRYWTPATLSKKVNENVVSGTRRRISDAVERHLLSDVPVATFLSGGLDSSVVTLLAQRALGNPIQAFSVGFKERKWDESEVAREVAESCGADFCRIELTEEEALESVAAAINSMDIPTIDGINTYIVSNAVRKEGVKVVLSGLGGDELFCGYPIFKEYDLLRRLAHMPVWIRGILRLSGSTGKRLSCLPNNSEPAEAFARWRRRFFTDKELNDMGLASVDWESNRVDDACFIDEKAALSWAEASVYMRNILLRDSDQMSMAHSLELRVPLLDLEVVEWALSIGKGEKCTGNFNKPLLISAFEEELPRSVYSRKKQGFDLPMDRWMRGPLEQVVNDGINALVKGLPWIELAMHNQIKAFRAHKIHWTRLWGFVVLGHWIKKNLR